MEVKCVVPGEKGNTIRGEKKNDPYTVLTTQRGSQPQSRVVPGERGINIKSIKLIYYNTEEFLTSFFLQKKHFEPNFYYFT